jgi:hypothetical protein
MGKAYFEFLEEEFQALSTELQRKLATTSRNQTEQGQGEGASSSSVDQQFRRCQAVLVQLRIESRTDPAFAERFALYKIQYQALYDHWEESMAERPQEVTYDLTPLGA